RPPENREDKNIPLEGVAFEKAHARRRHSASPAQSERKNHIFTQNDRPYGLKYKAFQTKTL
ncbi:hypothetical protein QUW15_12375, partial [Desulfovibrio piger]|nr:hypothetical protein [Desulfovibrio piger]